MENPKTQLINKLKEANNVLVTVSRNPSVDQLSAAIGLTLMLNKLGKHATAVFSGEVPSTLEFLQPEQTLERNTDSLRDFIISLDKAKADKLRYKVEDKMVKIFITPYRTSITQDDLVFSQGDFNVDVVMALGAHEKEDLDEAITSHGRILHDATVISINTSVTGHLGAINWVDDKTSSLSEMLVTICESLKADSLDGQMATAFLTGIVAETDRFSNEKTTSETMNISAKLMAAGANQQLVATKLQEPLPDPEPAPVEASEAALPEQPVADSGPADGSLDVTHEETPEPTEQSEVEEPPEPQIQPAETSLPDLNTGRKLMEPLPDETAPDEVSDEEKDGREGSRFVLEPPMLGGTLTANSRPEDVDPSTDPLSLPPVDSPILSHDSTSSEETPEQTDAVTSAAQPLADAAEDPVTDAEAEPAEKEIPDSQTLTELEAKVDSPHTSQPEASTQTPPDPDQALEEAMRIANTAQAPEALEVPAAFNAGGFMDVNHADEQTTSTVTDPALTTPPPPSNNIHIDPGTGELSFPGSAAPASTELPAASPPVSTDDPTAPPPVPPPMMPPFTPPADDSVADTQFPLPPTN